jgi:lysyl-tRNA synthetase class 2
MHDESRHPATEENQLVQIRKEKLQQLRAQGLDPFAVERFPITHTLQQVHDGYATLQGQTVAVAGRITAIRKMGKATFAHLMDSTGKLQIYLKADEQGERYELIDLWDLGDYLGVEGLCSRRAQARSPCMCSSSPCWRKPSAPCRSPKRRASNAGTNCTMSSSATASGT